MLVEGKYKAALFLSRLEIEKIQKGETTKKDEEENYLDLFSHKNMKLKERVLIPVKQYPKVRASKEPKLWDLLIFCGIFVPGKVSARFKSSF